MTAQQIDLIKNNLLRRVLDSCCYVDSSQCLAQLTPTRVEIAKSVHGAIGGITTCHKMRHCLSLPTVTSVWDSFHIFTMARHRPFCTLSRFKLLQVDQGSSVPLAKCSFGMIPLSRHSFDRSPKGVALLYPQCGTNTLFWGVKCLCWGKKAVSGWKPVLGRVLAMEWNVRGQFIGGSDLLNRQPFWVSGKGLSRQCIQAGYWGNL